MALWNLKVYGIVQGVGFRPFVSRLAERFGILGNVSNKGPYVEIFAKGDAAVLSAFRDEIEHRPPVRAVVLKLDTEYLDDDAAFSGFDIIESAREKGEIFVSPDIATCDRCKSELFDPKDRRYLHPFINCTACGPRLTILDSMPYDRERTSMGEFPMCDFCKWEYTHSETRRYDAQPVCCNECGPEVYILEGNERGADAIKKARQILSEGGIIAVKGIGGFHLACDATNSECVARLRELKHRPVKPFAVMALNMSVVERECVIKPEQMEILDGHQKPILLLEKKKNGKLAENVAPGNPKVGVMLPYAPIQMLLFDYPDDIVVPDVLIMTSGNPSGAPICRSDEDALESLAPLSDGILSHNRKIRLRADDSVMDFLDDKPYMIRRSRGYAPLPVFSSHVFMGKALAMGGELKNSFCLTHDRLFYLSPYLGDMTDLRTVRALKESVERMETLLEINPEIVACDLHPRYHTRELAESFSLPVVEVQHHYAHILSCMAENNMEDAVIGVSFDGTGYGTDETIWGGEFLLADYKGFRRLGSIQPFLQTGGDKASREGWRIALSMLYANPVTRARAAEISKELELAGEQETRIHLLMAEQGLNSIVSTSAGRLFDGISAILGIRGQSTFEGEGAMYLQFAAEKWARKNDKDSLESCKDELLSSESEERFLLPTNQLFSDMLEGRLNGRPKEELAFEFHLRLAKQILNGCLKSKKLTGLSCVALSGGVFQNTLLMKLVSDILTQYGFKVLRHSLIPPNDGGIALGQAVAAMMELKK